jgi:hypothetical protein
LIASTISLAFNFNSSKIKPFLTRHKLQTTVCHIKINLLASFLHLKGRPKDSKECSKLPGTTVITPSQAFIAIHTSTTTGHLHKIKLKINETKKKNQTKLKINEGRKFGRIKYLLISRNYFVQVFRY